MQTVKPAMLNEEMRRKMQGHIKKNCFKWKRDNKAKGKNEKEDEGGDRVSTADLVDDLIFVTDADVVNAVSDDQSWVIDSGATLHVTPRKEFFTSLKSGSFGKLKMGNDAVAEVVGIGDVCLETQMGTKLLLKDNQTFHSRSKHIDVRYHWIRDVLDAKLLELAKVQTDDNGADMLTKALPKWKFDVCCEIAGLAITST
ncbi:unnamed protein product [Cuscuta campestris]|uniref:Retrovirus-related Pol polyprotein from transposon TNT 1-94-like beta-barrel domain-containing protein n=1 Tax=Cuscuta campestris TaxID=132261 RepID=A0A484KP50_9ASTE|nr:unnamed protein product [Cuscuta campestris]